jgi:hypothetical protein
VADEGMSLVNFRLGPLPSNFTLNNNRLEKETIGLLATFGDLNLYVTIHLPEKEMAQGIHSRTRFILG